MFQMLKFWMMLTVTLMSCDQLLHLGLFSNLSGDLLLKVLVISVNNTNLKGESQKIACLKRRKKIQECDGYLLNLWFTLIQKPVKRCRKHEMSECLSWKQVSGWNLIRNDKASFKCVCKQGRVLARSSWGTSAIWISGDHDYVDKSMQTSHVLTD